MSARARCALWLLLAHITQCAGNFNASLPAGVLGFSDFESGMTPWYLDGCAGYGCPTVLTNDEVQQSGSWGYAGGGALKLLGDWNTLFLPTENTVGADQTLMLSLSFDLVVQSSWLPVIGLRLDDFNGNQLWSTRWYTNLNKWTDPSGNEHACGATSSIADGVAIEFQFTPTMGRMDGYINGVQVCSGYGQVDAAVTYQRWARIRVDMNNTDAVATNAIVDNLQLRTESVSAARPCCIGGASRWTSRREALRVRWREDL